MKLTPTQAAAEIRRLAWSIHQAKKMLERLTEQARAIAAALEPHL
jgi:hypothetical protein